MDMRNLILVLAVNAMMTLASCRHNVEINVKGVKNPVICLNGTWKVSLNGFEKAAGEGYDSLTWYEVAVPGELMMQGIPVKHNEPFLYSKSFVIPSDFKGKTVKIRFEGVYSYARVWINGNFIRDHSGGFTAWECDITSFVKPSEEVKMLVEVTDKADEISYASGYAKHQIGGILRSVSLLALPVNYAEQISVTTDFDDQFRNAILTVKGLTKQPGEDLRVGIELYSPDNQRISLESSLVSVTENGFEIRNKIDSPLKWDAEHPNLYSLRIRLLEKGEETWSRIYRTGFREIEVNGNEFRINGKPVKLRGACRHDIHPLLGRLSTPEYDLKDVMLAKDANINFIRTSHYPPDETFLELCDKYGIYVEDETAVCFVGSHRTAEYYPGSSESSPEFTGRYLSQLEEMVNNHRNHPSVIMWSIGNENTFGTNFKLSYDWIKTNDRSRPVIFSYPGQVPDSIRSYDVISMHYPGTNGDMDQYGMQTLSFGNDRMPVIFDEWAHVPCYNQETVSEDPNVRDFWGMSLDTMWMKVFEADGGLGGAIWGMIDETFMLPEELPGYNEWWGKLDKNVIPGKFTGHTIGYGEWGFIDTWRRKKPEFWSVKKAYSPVRVLKTEDYEFTKGGKIEIPVYNRFDFSDLNELTLKMYVNGKTFRHSLPDIQPHKKGVITIPLEEIPASGVIKVEFSGRDGSIIDFYDLSNKKEMISAAQTLFTGSAELSETENEFLIKCQNGVAFQLDKKSGLFNSFENKSGKKNISGPFINLRVLGNEVIYSSFTLNDLCKDWKPATIKAEKINNTVAINLRGEYSGNIKAEFDIVINPDGSVSSLYNVTGFPEGYVREAGIKFVFDNIFDSLYWKRETYWKGYPMGHLSGPEGIEPLFTDNNKVYRMEPQAEWTHDKKSFFYNGTGDETDNQLLNISRSTKENIYLYRLNVKEGGEVTVPGRGDRSCRSVKDGEKITLLINDIIDYPDISWGNYSRNIILKKDHSGKADIYFR